MEKYKPNEKSLRRQKEFNKILDTIERFTDKADYEDLKFVLTNVKKYIHNELKREKNLWGTEKRKVKKVM